MSVSSFEAVIRKLDYPMLLVTACAGGERDGCLVGFTTQCSIDPPRFLVCLSEKNRTTRIARCGPALAVHLLHRDAGDLAALFGGETGDEIDKFERCAWHRGPEDLPILDECRTWFVGSILDRTDFGDHAGFLLEPIAAHAQEEREPLLLFSEVRLLDPGHAP